MNFIQSVFGIVLFSILGMINDYINLRQGHYGIWLLFWINCVGMTLSLWGFFRCISDWIGERNILSRTLTWIKGIGKDSIIFLCFNQFAILITSNLILQIVPKKNGIIFTLIRQLSILILSIIELTLVRFIINGTKLRVIIGK